ncbi:hypothetical protein SUGI_0274610 [Cryptomeria japonica]|nr:hypothetical protein SUGI_0274610 [Cryptomeria japonica]
MRSLPQFEIPRENCRARISNYNSRGGRRASLSPIFIRALSSRPVSKPPEEKEEAVRDRVDRETVVIVIDSALTTSIRARRR